MKYGFIGCGNMGGAIATALSKSTKQILVTDRSGKAADLAARLEITYTDTRQITETCDAIFLAVKPHMMKGCLVPLQDTLCQRKPLLISMAAGLEISQIEDFAGCRLPVIRIMPNTPTAIGRGVLPYCPNDLVSDDILAAWLADMQPCGLLDPLDESLMNAASALSGSGPAYMYILLEALADGAVACGLPRQKALDYAAMTMAGAAQMYLSTHTHPGALKDAVCSPGGSTIAGIRALESQGFRGAAMNCVLEAYRKNTELGK
ncbi:MAG: pyrroline-5-carboxylate reductase [Ruminococcaceae bacterium]|nr:pyrroline-5-carboxylate reductase [Oscillospiraceae bacterium]